MPAFPARKLGNWKMAYADFLTALMAFFLLMWLVSGVSPDDRSAIAARFKLGDTASAAASVPPVPAEATRLYSLLTLADALEKAGDSVILTAEPDGVRLDLVDTSGRPLFESASGALTPDGRALVAAIAGTLAPLPNPLSIEGHTDAFTLTQAGYSNWELSADRANEARRLLEAGGIAPDRVRSVSGLSDTRPLDPGQPHLAQNRRISLKVQLGEPL
ncbi:MAG: OmpA family protein [Alphaproteobacteria bacterium]|jgi:chemotaxis protein MotB|uniref:OmpA family protein n=1 Tax=Hyphomonas sp. TaxID=87 RepID=UPI001DF02079|nr:OmpA family protein [Hyphomonas sp.]MBU3922563.1 OmpA family protein [Alphaproteobacteria bacterium]MBU4063076.1 OmpA family protein [Alphaproteobacteria bacterium]MBU4164393.1 OmpA family protein [Alphaproteobacteria bacterium]MBU4569547.1 OmpA family protein [Alphaproteobacteria bacterium]